MGVFSLISNSANLRQSLMPMKLKEGGINAYYANSTAIGSGTAPQFFSFKASKQKEGAAGGFGLLNICPSSFKQFMNDDIGYQLLYNYAKNTGITQESINANAVFDNLPSLQIREYAIDNELDQLVNLFRDLVNVFNPGDKNAPSNSVQKDSTGGQPAEGAGVNAAKKIADEIKNIWDQLRQKLEDDGFYKSIYGNQVDPYTKNIVSPVKEKVVRFPFAVYYKLLSCVTTNCYEVPIHPEFIIQSKSEGFDADEYAMKFPGDGMIASIPIIGNIIKRLMSSIAINTSPVWDPSATTKTGPTITCKFKLFNDTVDAAVNNFIFTQTIAANNMWYNYSIFKRAPALYDIKVNGVCRWYMCSATVMVKPAGPIRKVPKSLISKIFAAAAEDNKTIKTAENLEHEQKDQEQTDKKKEAVDKEIEAEEKRIEELVNQQQDLQDQINALDTEDSSTYTKRSELQNEIDILEDELDRESEKISQLRAKKQDLQDKHDQLVRDNAAAVIATSNITPSAVQNEYIDIPDIYDVELSFTSMLPNNFNNFLYNYAGNPDIMNSDKGYQQSVVVDFIKTLAKQLVHI